MSNQPIDEGQLDLTSEPTPAAPAAAKASASKSSAAPRPTTARVYFKCCRVYTVIRVPEGVLNGKLSSWRFHCPRCGQLSEIPL